MTDVKRNEHNSIANSSQGPSMPGLSDDDEQPDDRIILCGGNHTSYWRLPTKIKRCIISSCGRKFEHSELLAAHFLKHHAKKTTYCGMCDSPVVCAIYPDDLTSHYSRIHPKVPFKCDQTKIKQEAIENDLLAEQDNCAAVDDTIKLTGLERVTYWTFPQINYCPHPNCQKDFENRSETISHFEAAHSDHAILCSVCVPQKPIYTYSIDGFKVHYRNNHPNAEIPYGFDESTDDQANDQTPQQIDEVPIRNDEKLDENQEDLITLSACGVTTYYPFPQTTQCPKKVCSEKFDTRALAKEHYIAEHASESIYCSLCSSVVTVRRPKLFVEHFRRSHPHDKVPFGFDIHNNASTMEVQNNVCDDAPQDDPITLNGCGIETHWTVPAGMLKCPTLKCEKKFKVRSDLIRHFKESHAVGSILCYECQRPIRALRFDQYVIHYRRMHPFVKVPFTDGSQDGQLSLEEMAVQLENNLSASLDNMDDGSDGIIILTGLGQRTEWRIPPNTTRCPVNKCREPFVDRSALTSHYQEQHAPHLALCESCDKPISANHISNVQRHYREKHPNAGQPLKLLSLFRNARKSTHGRPTENALDGSDIESDEENDLIILEGCGLRTEYHFPKETTSCPLYACRKDFGIRALAIDHFKYQHTKHSVFCEVCQKAISARCPATFLAHYKKLHPDVEPPEFLTKPIPKEVENEIVDDGIDDDDLIKLEGAGIITQWTFPDQTKCPNKQCQIEFATRSHAIIHYKRQHAKNAILCELCSKPIATHTVNTFVNHYRQTHPFKKIPYGLDDEGAQSLGSQDEETDEEEVDDSIELKGLGLVGLWQFPKNINRCPSKGCSVVYKSRSALVAHYRSTHAPINVLCPICQKPFQATYPTNVFQHFKHNHKNVRIPAELNALMPNVNGNNEEDDLIQLSGCGQITTFRFPNTTRCPAYNCKVDSGFRARAIAHYKRKHAKDHIFCDECQRPVGVKCVDFLLTHYTVNHPNAELPEFLKNQQSESESEDDEVDDLITLTTESGITGEWHFPKKFKKFQVCPSPGCNGRFENRSQAIAHYRKCHSNAILCPVCEKPISAKLMHNFTRHFREIHPGEELPAYIQEKIKPKKRVSNINETVESDNDEQNDWIMLTGANRISQWQFPDVLSCPVQGCDGIFKTRSETMRHYKKNHSMNFQYCSICAKPVSGHNLYTFKKHFLNNHANMSLPSDFSDEEDELIQLKGGNQTTEWRFARTIRKKCPAVNCDLEFGVRSDIRDHFKKRHTSDHFYCKKCDKLIFACDQSGYDKHQRKAHSSVTQKTGSERPISAFFTPVPSTSKVNLTSSTVDGSEDENEVIELKGQGTLTRWKLPIGMKKCPVHRCDMQSDTRLALVNHYKENHAKYAVYCTICRKPIMCHDICNLKGHYSRIHPNEKFPSLITDDQKPQQLPKTKLLRSSGIIEKIDELDDVITLKDCNNKQPVEWIFPDITLCPVELCRREFGSRMHAFKHFQQRHLKNAQFCSKCSEPVDVYCPEDVREHEHRVHQNENHATDSDRLSNVSRASSSTPQNNNPSPYYCDDDSEDDLISLSGLDSSAKYRFPLIKYCPLTSCMVIFGVRSDAITHFKKKHSANAVLCPICKNPILVPEIGLHYQELHPKDDIPINFNVDTESSSDEPLAKVYKISNTSSAVVRKPHSTEKDNIDEDLLELEGCNIRTTWRFPEGTKECPALRCDFAFSTHTACRNHFKKVHAKHSICCPECKKQYVAFNPRNFIAHFEKTHPNSKMPFKFDQASGSTVEKDVKGEDIGSDDSDSASEDKITLNGCGITTKWRVPAGLTKCPVLTCHQDFKMRSAFISHYKENHAKGSILCTACVPPKPIRVNAHFRDFKSHFERAHPNQVMPFDFGEGLDREKVMHLKSTANKNATNENESTDNTDPNDDLIKLTGLKRTSLWQFPENSKKCPLFRCKTEFKTRTLAIQHYRAHHASTSVLCFICKKPISVKNNPANYKTHFQSMHPNVKFSLSQKMQSSSQSNRPPKHSVKVRSSIMQSSDKKKACSVCGIKFRNLNRHMMEMHSKKRILCPLKSCDFTSKRLVFIREHWKKAHQNFRFPEIDQSSGFTYKTTTVDSEENISTSEATNNSHVEAKKQTPKRCKMEDKADQSLLMPPDENSNSDESSVEDDSSASGMVQKNRNVIRNKRRRQISENSCSSSDYETQKPGPKRFKLMKEHAKDSEPVTMESAKGSTIPLNGLIDCSVSLEKLDMHELNKSNPINPKQESPVKKPVVTKTTPLKTTAVSQQPIKIAEPESVVVDMDIEMIETMAPANEVVTAADHNDMVYADALNIEPEIHVNYFFETDQFNEMLESSMRLNFDRNELNAYENYNPVQDPLIDYSELPNFQVKEEKVNASPPTLHQTLSNDSVVYEILDSDEEDALNSRDSGRETNDTIIDTDSSHIPTMGVLMMAKK